MNLSSKTCNLQQNYEYKFFTFLMISFIHFLVSKNAGMEVLNFNLKLSAGYSTQTYYFIFKEYSEYFNFILTG